MKKLTFALAILSLVTAFVACKKEEKKPVVTGGTVKSLDDLYERNAPAVQKFKIDASKGGKIVGDRGYVFYMQPGDWRMSNNTAATGNIDIELIEVANAVDILGTGAFTSASDGLLGTVGMFKLTARKNGEELKVGGNGIVAQVVTDENMNMSNVAIFKGENVMANIDSDNTSNNPRVQWNPTGDTTRINSDSIRNVFDSLHKFSKVKKICTLTLRFNGWCNLDKYINSTTGFPILVKYTPNPKISNVRAILYLNGKTSIDPRGLFELFYSADYSFNSSFYNLPPGLELKIIAVANDSDGNLVYKVKDVVHSSNPIVIDAWDSISADDFLNYMKSLW